MPGFAAFNETLKAPPSGRTAFQNAFNTDGSFYEWLKTRPLENDAFNHLMEKLTSGLDSWLDAIDFPSELATGITADEVAFVDVGGGIGHQSKALKERYPELPGRIIVQDLPEVVEQAVAMPGVETMSYDYRTEQPIKSKSSSSSIQVPFYQTHSKFIMSLYADARVYYFRAVFHNNDDAACLKILESTIPAMGENSVIVIDDKVLPDDKMTPGSIEKGAGAEYGSAVSLAMMMIFKSQERRAAHWRKLIGEAELVVREIREFTHLGDSLIIAAKKRSEGLKGSI